MNTEPKQYRTIGLKFKHITCAITCAISTVYWVVTGLVRTQRFQNSPPKISLRIARARSAPSALTLPAPPLRSFRRQFISCIGGASIAVVLSVACSKFFFYYFFVISILVILFSVRHLKTLVRSFRSYL